MSSKLSRKKLIAKLDKLFSEYIRKRNADKKGYVECFTCGKKDYWKRLQCGHFQSRKHLSTRWDEVNCQVQCPACNVFRYGEQYKFGRNLNLTFGDKTSEKLYFKAKQTKKFTNFEILDLIEKYKNLI